MKIKLGYSLPKWEKGIKQPIFWEPDSSSAHLLVSGVTGGGKSVFSALVLKSLLDYDEVEVWIADYKAGGDWNNILPAQRYAEYNGCDVILDRFYELFKETIKEHGHEHRFLLFDEFNSFALSKDSKEYKVLMAKISHIAYMGRSFGYHLILIAHQFSSRIIDTGIREQFGIRIYMASTISSESAIMLFPGVEIEKAKRLPRYCGFISTPTIELTTFTVPYVNNYFALKKLLKRKARRLDTGGDV